MRATPDNDAALQSGAIVDGRYRIVRLLGQGGMGAVYAAEHTITGRAVALKMLLGRLAEDASTVARFMQEAKAGATIAHPNAIEVIDVFLTESGAPVMVMELLHGSDLAARLEAQGRLSLGEMARIMTPVLGALATAHARRIVHRDLKPENIFLAERDGTMVPKVLDFGIAKVLKDRGVDPESLKLTSTGMMLGTPFYMSPEQASGRREIDHRSDLWSIGVVMYECLAGRRPFEGENFGQLFAAILQDDPPPLGSLVAGLPEPVTALVAQCLAKRAVDRPESAGAIANALAPWSSMAIGALPAPAAVLERREAISTADTMVASTGSAVGPRGAMAATLASVELRAPVARKRRSLGWAAVAVVVAAAGIGAVRLVPRSHSTATRGATAHPLVAPAAPLAPTSTSSPAHEPPAVLPAAPLAPIAREPEAVSATPMVTSTASLAPVRATAPSALRPSHVAHHRPATAATPTPAAQPTNGLLREPM